MNLKHAGLTRQVGAKWFEALKYNIQLILIIILNFRNVNMLLLAVNFKETQEDELY